MGYRASGTIKQIIFMILYLWGNRFMSNMLLEPKWKDGDYLVPELLHRVPCLKLEFRKWGDRRRELERMIKNKIKLRERMVKNRIKWNRLILQTKVPRDRDCGLNWGFPFTIFSSSPSLPHSDAVLSRRVLGQHSK